MVFPKKYYEEYAYVLDFIPSPLKRYRGYRGPVAQVVGENFFTLLEVAPYRGMTLSVGERVFIGRGIREKVERVLRRITYDDLTPLARDELPGIVEEIVSKQEQRFVDFFNKAPPLTTKMHSLELLRGIGKKTLWRILEERRKKPFSSFDDIKKRVKIPDPRKLVIERILEEIRGEEKYYIFVAPPPKPHGAYY
ncbi:MAG: DUF655 domain-containing protein [Thermoprotei archaeon]|nr:MAG: DUF655 domain-containing protein [Thermoprotei archaeon]RLE99278.1 MAG: DUF655 domain-containing protein [Thermoprotei archaeon]